MALTSVDASTFSATATFRSVVPRAKVGGGIYISGSGTLVRALLSEGLVDELYLLVYPIVLGSGAKLFPDGAQRTPLTLAGQEAFENGVLHLTYTPAAP